ncbi:MULTISPECIES: hypothetical protein [unclassified Arthrobacter]|uniref:hypothetical protein n=1 Tax=Arthrobacter sp. Leaf234 TaxID=1736303 RepID=UPI0006F797E8|nr:hypothetical protein [Arthrobacter sp. Leaf234]KQO03717.1 hypothetical protein ASF21_05580 [Arthrobacter sp. Leaf234]
MLETARRRYRVRLRRAVAGSFLAAASAAALSGMAPVPALAVAPSSVIETSDLAESPDYDTDGLVRGFDTGSTVGLAVPAPLVLAGPAVAGSANAGPTAAERLAGVRSDLDQAVLLRLVTSEQADGFYAKIQRRVAAGL